jgi:hypothetical protein
LHIISALSASRICRSQDSRGTGIANDRRTTGNPFSVSPNALLHALQPKKKARGVEALWTVEPSPKKKQL